MIPVDQTKFGETEGNCFAACLASILECPLDEVPDAMALHQAGKSWRRMLDQWLFERGLWYQELDYEARGKWTMWLPPSYHIIGGASPRGYSCGHSVVGFQGEMVHDPHPDRTGVTKIQDYGFFVHLFPSAERPANLFRTRRIEVSDGPVS